MEYQYLNTDHIRAFIQAALKEDIGDGDHSSLASVPAQAERKAQLLIKGEGVLAGMELAGHIFAEVDPDLELTLFKSDGELVQFGDIGLIVKGRARSILKAERLALNCLQRMSGIASLTQELVNLVSHTSAQLLDTRKTTPNFRLPEKWAVKIGGGQNHRYGLFDMIMLKDNHIAYAGGIKAAVERTHAYLKEHQKDLKIVIETQNLDEFQEVLGLGGVDRIMLDNMSNDQMREAVRLNQGQFPLEASGGITKTTIRGVAETGVDYISVGALTHSASSIDISLKAIK